MNQQPKSRTTFSKALLITLQVFQGLTLLPWPFMAMTAVMFFDAPGSTSLAAPWMFALAIWTYPLWVGLAGVGSWILMNKGHRLASLVLATVFVLPIPVFFGFVFLS